VKTLLLADIGNTTSTLALARGNRVVHMTRVPGGITDRRGIRHAVHALAAGAEPTGSVLCSVVPTSTPIWTDELRRASAAPLVVTHQIELGVEIDYPEPASIGADRLANACAAFSRYGAPVIVADFGTALTFDVVSPKGAYTGGVIAPGLPLMTDYLAEKTALLPHVHLRGRCQRVGRSTEGAMRIGAKIGYRGMVREIVQYLVEGMDTDRVALCATGGFARWALQGSNMPFTFAPDLTLFGLTKIYQLNNRP